MKTFGQIAYEAYCSTFSCEQTPWDKLTATQRKAWQRAAEAAVNEFLCVSKPPTQKRK
jgi:hypothetical protein